MNSTNTQGQPYIGVVANTSDQQEADGAASPTMSRSSKDVTERPREAEARIQFTAYDLPHRATQPDAVGPSQEAILASERSKFHGVVMPDVNGFKMPNDAGARGWRPESPVR